MSPVATNPSFQNTEILLKSTLSSSNHVCVNGFLFGYEPQINLIGIDKYDEKTNLAAIDQDPELYKALSFLLSKRRELEIASMLNVYGIGHIGQFCGFDNDPTPERILKILGNPFLSDGIRKELSALMPNPGVSFYALKQVERSMGRNRLPPKNGKAENGFVYLIKSSDGLYKIGKSKDAKKRIDSLGVQLPFPIKVEHLIQSNDYSRAEKQLHEQFKEKRMRGEWFNLSKSDIAEIKNIESINFDGVRI